MTNPLPPEIRILSQSVWLSYIQRNILENGGVTRMIVTAELAGMTSNPTIFEKEINQHNGYKEEISEILRNGVSAIKIYETLAFEVVQLAADLFRPIYDESTGRDGFVSLEVLAYLTYNTKQTIATAKRLWIVLGRPNGQRITGGRRRAKIRCSF